MPQLLVLALFMIHLGHAMYIPGRSYRGPLPPLTAEETSLRDRLFRHVDMLGRIVGERNVLIPGTLDTSAGYITKVWRDMGYEPTEQSYQAGGRVVKNLIVEIRGASKPDEILVIGAHYDSVRGSPGANDNATGVAATIEIARMLHDSHPARTIRFVAFVNEEPPFFHAIEMGSLVYARSCKQRGDNIVGMITPETIGCYSDAPNSQRYPLPALGWFYPDRGNFIAFVGDFGSRALLKDAVGSFRSHTRFPSIGGVVPQFVTGVGWSDHWSFWQFGYPAIMVTDTAPFRYPHYHRPTDTPDKIDYDRLARVVAGLGRVVSELANAR